LPDTAIGYPNITDSALPNPDEPESINEINHKSTKTREKDKANFVFSKFRGFVVKTFFHKMQRIHDEDSKFSGCMNNLTKAALKAPERIK